LSKGLHELTDEECKLFFPTLREAIVAMLTDVHAQREREKSARRIEAEISKISSRL
jgi:hypothetical protein